MLATQSSELQATQARVDSPFGVQFLHIPQVKPANAASSMATKDCQETSRDGTTDMDCIDD